MNITAIDASREQRHVRSTATTIIITRASTSTTRTITINGTITIATASQERASLLCRVLRAYYDKSVLLLVLLVLLPLTVLLRACLLCRGDWHDWRRDWHFIAIAIVLFIVIVYSTVARVAC